MRGVEYRRVSSFHSMPLAIIMKKESIEGFKELAKKAEPTKWTEERIKEAENFLKGIKDEPAS